jgi:hypothetical protein
MSNLPPKPDWFDARLAEVHTHFGRPFFRVVDGTKETEFLNDNPRSIKHWDLVEGKGRVGRECWVIEYLQAPEEMATEEVWEMLRYQTLNVYGVPRRVDSFGPYPRDGRYKHYKDLRDAEKRPLPLTQSVIDDLKAEVANYFANKSLSADEEVASSEINAEEWEQERIKQAAANFYDLHGLAAQKMFHSVATNVSPRLPKPDDNQRRIWLPGDE